MSQEKLLGVCDYGGDNLKTDVSFLGGGESRLTAAIPMDNPYCSCERTRVRPRAQGATQAAAWSSSEQRT